jgi:hypothetical protein
LFYEASFQLANNVVRISEYSQDTSVKVSFQSVTARPLSGPESPTFPEGESADYSPYATAEQGLRPCPIGVAFKRTWKTSSG